MPKQKKKISSLNEYLEDKTAIIITHRIFSLFNFDKIVVLEDGAIVEEGTHQSLLAQNGIMQAYMPVRGRIVIFMSMFAYPSQRVVSADDDDPTGVGRLEQSVHEITDPGSPPFVERRAGECRRRCRQSSRPADLRVLAAMIPGDSSVAREADADGALTAVPAAERAPQRGTGGKEGLA